MRSSTRSDSTPALLGPDVQATLSGARSRLAGVQWRYRASSGRDLRLDFLRGFLIFVMVVDHIGGDSWLRVLTGSDGFIVSAAEGFVLLSGLLMGTIYQRLIARDGMLAAVRKLLGRGLKLYGLHVVLSLSLAAASKVSGAPWAGSIDDPAAYLRGLLTLQSTNYLADIILLYAILVLLAPIPLFLLARGYTPLAVAGSGLVWLAYQNDPVTLGTLTANYAFPAAGWQVFFVAGLVLGYHRRAIGAHVERIKPGLLWGPLAVAAVGLVAAHYWFTTQLPVGDPLRLDYERFFYKWEVQPGRLLAGAVFFPLVYKLVTLVWQPLTALLGWLLLPMGQNALLAYSVHVYVVLLATVSMPLSPVYAGDETVANGLFQLGGLILVWSATNVAFPQLWTEWSKAIYRALAGWGGRRLTPNAG